jgi:hypothetical protein
VTVRVNGGDSRRQRGWERACERSPLRSSGGSATRPSWKIDRQLTLAALEIRHGLLKVTREEGMPRGSLVGVLLDEPARRRNRSALVHLAQLSLQLTSRRRPHSHPPNQLHSSATPTSSDSRTSSTRSQKCHQSSSSALTHSPPPSKQRSLSALRRLCVVSE